MITRPKDCQRGPMKELAKRAIVAACGVSLCSYQQSPNQAMGSTIRPFVQIAEEQPAHDQIPIDDAINKCVAIANIHPGLRFPAGWRFEAWLDVETAGETVGADFQPKMGVISATVLRRLCTLHARQRPTACYEKWQNP